MLVNIPQKAQGIAIFSERSDKRKWVPLVSRHTEEGKRIGVIDLQMYNDLSANELKREMYHERDAQFSIPLIQS